MVVSSTRLVVVLFGLRDVNEFVNFLDNNRKLLICQAVMCWPPQVPANPSHTIGGRRLVREVLGEGWVSSVRSNYPHMSRGGTSTNYSGKFLVAVVVFWCLWCNF